MNLFVIYQNQGYKIAKENIKQMFDATINIRNKEVYQQFWKRYKRPPIKVYQEYIIERRDLLVPQDIRERKGAYFTPRQWVELSQKYLTDYLGDNWQDEYYVWDCAAGTGNLLAGLTNKYNIYASTIDQADVNVMHERIDRGANLLKNHVFQFDFLNDDFTKLPLSLQKIINDPEKRKKLVVYINPPYAEATSSKTVSGSGKNKGGVSTNYKFNEIIKPKIGNACNELFALFMARIYKDIPDCIIGQFTKLKFINGSNFKKFKEYFLVDYVGGFVVPADTFDNVTGTFPIGFTVWNTFVKNKIKNISTDVYNKKVEYQSTKIFYGDLSNTINKWIKQYLDIDGNEILGYLPSPAPDFQNQSFLFITRNIGTRHVYYLPITIKNILEAAVYFSVRHALTATWLNDRDQFLYPKVESEIDSEFHTDCLVFTLFHGQNRISSNDGVNHWIPFTEQEVNAQERFESNFMSDFLKGKFSNDKDLTLFSTNALQNKPLEFSEEAKAVFDAGRALWSYYHAQPNVNVNASYYDIREYFQGRDSKGKMNSKSNDVTYTALHAELKSKMAFLADKIKPKIYEYEFLKA